MGSPFEKPPESPPPYGGVQSGPFTPDLVIGIILIVLSVFGAIMGLFLGGVGVIASSASGDIARQQGVSGGDVRVAAGIVGILAVFIIVVCILNILIGIGFIGSKRWAFIAAIVVNSLSAFSSLLKFDAFNIISIAISIGLIIYSSMRLSGNIGPRTT